MRTGTSLQLIVALAVLALAIFPASAQALDRYVNPDGICGGNTPCYSTIQAAIDASSAGDMIHLDAAVYTPTPSPLPCVPGKGPFPFFA